MTHDRLVELTTKLHETSRLSTSEAREFARLFRSDDPGSGLVAFRLVTQTDRLRRCRTIQHRLQAAFRVRISREDPMKTRERILAGSACRARCSIRAGGWPTL